MAAQSIKGRGGPSAEGFKSISAELETVAVLCSAIPEIDEELRTLVARVDALDGSIDELEGEADELRAEVEDLGDALRQLTANVAELEETVDEKAGALEERADDLESRLETVEACLNPDILDERQAHVEAQDDSIPFDRGDERELFIEEVEAGPNPTLRGKIEKVQTFVDVDDASEYGEGDVVNVVITDLNETAAHAAPAAEFEG
jgi:chromosome segregation ATPase